jgi:hypothetical protein
MKVWCALLLATLLASAAPTAYADPVPGPGTALSGTVFRDFNANGVRDQGRNIDNAGNASNSNAGTSPLAEDTAVSGVTVTAYCVTGLGADGLPGTIDDLITSFGPVTTGADGNYSIPTAGVVAAPLPCRLEFTNLPAGYEPTTFGSGAGATSGTSVQFATPGTSNLSFGINRPAEFCQDNPELISSCYRFGDQVNGANQDEVVVLSFPYNAGSSRTTGGAPYDDFDQPTTHAIELLAEEVGTTFAMAYRRTTREIYLAAFYKRHAGFGPGADGQPNTADDAVGLYRYDIDSDTLTAFSAPGPATNAHDTTNGDQGYLRDNNTTGWDAVGKTSIGGITLSGDEQTLYVLNLADRIIYALDADTGVQTNSLVVPTANIPTPGGTAATCAANDVRPFALRYWMGKIYVGMVCSAESTNALADLWAYVYTVNPGTLAFDASPVLQFPLNYPRGKATIRESQSARWNPWRPTFTAIPATTGEPGGRFPVYPQPMLTNLIFDERGDMLLGLRDRFGEQVGNLTQSNPANNNFLYRGVAAGDVLKACVSGNSWALESNGRCGGQGTAPQNTGEGPGNGEFFFTDDYQDFHDEIAVGGIVAIPGYSHVIATVIEPILSPPANTAVVADGGVRHFNNITGGGGSAYRIYDSTFDVRDLFAKANGLGDIEVLCDAAPIEIGNRVWNDSNGNGVQDPGEAPIAGVTVQLFKSNVLVASAVTSAAGEYYFRAGTGPDANPNDQFGLVDGGIQYNQTDYELRIDLTQAALAGLFLTTPNVDAGPNGDNLDSDYIQQGTTAILAIANSGAPGQNNHTYDGGFNAAALYDLGDLPDPGPGTGPGNYQTLLSDNGPRHLIVPGVFLGSRVDGEDDGQPSVNADGDDLNPATADDEDGVTFGPIIAGQSYVITVTASVNGFLNAWIDFNGDGDFDDPGEQIAADRPVNAGVNVLNGVAPATLAPQLYSRFRFTTNNPLTELGPTGEWDNGEVEDYVVPSGALVNLGNLVWHDLNNNGFKEPTENGIDGVTVQLFRADQTPGVDTPLATDSTAGGGFYNFDNLPPGNYIVYIPQPPAVYPVSSTTTDLADNGEDNDDNGDQPGGPGAPVRSPVINLAVGAEPNTPVDGDGPNGDLTIDFGFFAPVRVGDFVWFDNNQNGLQDGGEPGVPNVTVRLFRSDGTPAQDVGGVAVPPQQTGADGRYLFTNLPPGSYYVVFDRSTLPAGYLITTPNAGDDALDSDADPTTGQTAATPFLNSNQEDLTLDMGIVQVAPVRVGDFVWLDGNYNGCQDPGEPGVPSVTVTLFNAATNQQVATTQTDSNGFYLFDNLPPGQYYVVFNRATLPPGHDITRQNACGNDDSRDSDVNPTTGRSDNSRNLNPGEEDRTLDLGIYALLALGDLVWEDVNNNGLRDAGEQGLPAIPVRLYTITGTLVATTTTNLSGNYRFTDLLPGEYYVEITVPPGYASSTGGAPGSPTGPYEPAPDPDNNIDNDDNGTAQTNPQIIRSAPVTLAIGTEPADYKVTNDRNYNPTVDFGICQNCGTGGGALASLGDRVWIDRVCDGIQSPSETQSPTVTVTVNLLNANGAVIATTQTDANGFYRFNLLPPGIYRVEFVNPNALLYRFTEPNKGSDVALDSNANVNSGQTGLVQLSANETNLTIDAGLCLPTSLPDEEEPESTTPALFMPMIQGR